MMTEHKWHLAILQKLYSHMVNDFIGYVSSTAKRMKRAWVTAWSMMVTHSHLSQKSISEAEEETRDWGQAAFRHVQRQAGKT